MSGSSCPGLVFGSDCPGGECPDTSTPVSIRSVYTAVAADGFVQLTRRTSPVRLVSAIHASEYVLLHFDVMWMWPLLHWANMLTTSRSNTYAYHYRPHAVRSTIFCRSLVTVTSYITQQVNSLFQQLYNTITIYFYISKM